MLVGRDDELSAVERLIEGARAGGGGALGIVGEPGVGKTALLQAARARAGGALVLTARGLQSEAELPFAGVLDLVRPVLGLRDRLPPPQSVALAGALALGPPAAGDRFAVCVAVRGIVSLAAEERPQLVVVDDLHWLDAPSRECVLYLARRLPRSVAMLLASRDEPAGGPPAGVPALRLQRLDDVAATALLAARAPELPAPVVAELVGAAGGVPLALVELLEALTPDQRAGRAPVERPVAAGTELHRSFAGRIAALSASGRTALLVLAANAGAELAPVVRALDRLGVTADALEEAEDAGLLRLAAGAAELVHPLVGTVAYHEATSAARRRAHRALAAAVGGERAAWHRAAAATRPSEAVAADLERVAGGARARRAHATAAAALDRAARLSPDDGERVRRLVESAREAATAGLSQQARRALEEVDERATDPALRLEATNLRGFLEAWDGDVMDGGEILARAGSELAPADPLAAAALQADAAMVASVAGDCRAALERAQTAAALQGEGDEAGTRARVLAALYWALVLRGQTRRARRLLAELDALLPHFDPRSPEAQFLLIAINVRTPTEEYERARAHALGIAAAAREDGALAALPIALSIAADAGQRLGSWRAARDDLAEIVELSDATGQRMPLVHALGVIARLEAATGREDRARAAVDRAVGVGRRSRVGSMLMFATAALGFLELGRANVDAALPPLELCEQMASYSGLEEPLLIPWAPDLVEALARAGRYADARRVTRQLDRRARATGTATAAALAARCHGIVAPDAGESEFGAALEHHRRSPMPFERARTQLAYGAKLHRARRRAEARRQLYAAVEVFDELEAGPWAEQARAELRAAGARRRTRQTGLTPAEQRVARAVARGATNREAATELFLSPKTVDFHLRHAYRKLGVRNRTELALALAPAEPSDER